MNPVFTPPPPPCPEHASSDAPGSPQSFAGGWTLHDFQSLGSTNIEARALPAWHAVRSASQTNGYGRTGRTWVSDAGGLWISAVLPTPGPAEPWSILPLAAGWAVIDALENLGVADLRIRWPNDVMLGDRKIAGLLLERFSPSTAIVGLGLNVFNQPAAVDPALAGSVVSLAEVLPDPGSLDDITALMLRALRKVHRELITDGFSRIAADLSQRHLPAQVALALNGHHTALHGRFRGVDDRGRLRISTADGLHRSFAAHEVAHLRELR